MEKVSQKKDREYKGRTGKSGKPQGENRRPERAGQKDGGKPKWQNNSGKPEKQRQDDGGKPERQRQVGGGKPEKQRQVGGRKPKQQEQSGSGKPRQKEQSGGKQEKQWQSGSGQQKRQAQQNGSGRMKKQEQNGGRNPRQQAQYDGGRQKMEGRQEKETGGALQCPVAKKCGGCRGFGISYQQQLQKKAKILEEQCGKFGRFAPIIGMQNPYYYRNKVHAVFGEDRRHNIISGIYEEGTHRIVPVDSCLLENRKADEIIVSIRGLLKSFKIRPYDEDRGYGLLRHVLIRTGYVTGEIMVVLVLTSPILPSKNNFVKALLKLHPEITTIVLNVNGKDTSMVLGEKETVLYGKGYIEDVLAGKTFRISSRSFYQVNPIQTEKLYGKAVEYAALSGRETVLDAYCGIGTIGLIASDKAKEVIGVELNPAAIRDAITNAKRNGVTNITFYENDAGKLIEQMAKQEAVVDVVFMDPPRAGSTEVFLDALAKLNPKRVVYVSCNPETLARELRYLGKKGYRMEKGTGVDMFPWTTSIEAVALLSYKKLTV